MAVLSEHASYLTAIPIKQIEVDFFWQALAGLDEKPTVGGQLGVAWIVRDGPVLSRAKLHGSMALGIGC